MKRIEKEILAEMEQMGIIEKLSVLSFVLRLRVRRQRHLALNACLFVVVLVLALLLSWVKP